MGAVTSICKQRRVQQQLDLKESMDLHKTSQPSNENKGEEEKKSWTEISFLRAGRSHPSLRAEDSNLRR